MSLNLKRPIIVIDLETTGLEVDTARIVALGITRIDPNGAMGEPQEWRVNPGVPIPAEATAVHGISDADVRDCPSFAELAPQIAPQLSDCDLAGYNIAKYDLPILRAEYARAGMADFGNDACVIDVMTIFKKQVSRDLSGAVRYYLQQDHSGAHTAAADAQATAEILLTQIATHDIPSDAAGLQRYCNEKPDHYIDQAGKFVWKGNVATINFGKHRGTSLEELARTNRDYFEWMLTKDFAEDLLGIVKDVLAGNVPVR